MGTHRTGVEGADERAGVRDRAPVVGSEGAGSIGDLIEAMSGGKPRKRPIRSYRPRNRGSPATIPYSALANHANEAFHQEIDETSTPK